ncbi:tetratricopeptide (TPR) repeat protein [Enterococcus sp. PF1-24]|uniref:tetratricopeptide repeat protein n=1 Tax=unclassified Enterococcus TaxID=2608891 RepID=UPI0024730358|nr:MULTISPECIES: tetratricopeptide repeat protein [unclassified Enterococcus]MDH6365517.1 tetratricopeptide (TPR) repeat protein [Enterococcus sp. PFB1-1]MDH6402618.1 tetratricopeptide (TPR) repeat protein [Enterococcus sp. PF1-24]
MKKLEQALLLRKEGSLEESNELFLELVKENKNDPYLNYQTAWSFDALSKEAEAVPYYEKSIQNGLEGADLEGALIGLGSTYRTLGNYDSAAKVLKEGIEKFPSNNALRVFYAMVLYNLERYSEGMEILLSLLATTSNDQNIQDYSRAIMHYSNKLNLLWE